MKVIKKITAMMLSIMMVLGMCSVVGAADGAADGASGSYKDDKGTITITSAIDKQEYTIYRMLKLESFSGKNYSYKAETEWETFVKTVKTNGNKNYFQVDAVNGYVEWNPEVKDNDANKAELAKKALEYAKDSKNSITTPEGYKKTADATRTVKYTDLPLGYYLVDSSVGALCGLTTTNLDVEIQEKNGVPSVEKQVYDGSNYGSQSYAKIGESVLFLITVHVKKGAYKYKVYDEMSKGFKLADNENPDMPAIHIFSYTDGIKIETTDYETTINTDKKGFQIQFKDEFLERYKDKEYDINIGYSAILTGDATIGKDNGNTNTAYLTYGDTNTESNKPTTNTYTFGIPVFKYTGANSALAGATFSLYSDEKCNEDTRIDLLKADTTKETYRRFITGDNASNKVTEITTTDTGKFNITGLKPGTYYLKEIAAPKGYNLLAAPTTVEVTSDGIIKVKKGEVMEETSVVNVENKSGTILPSTGGMGTTIFYIAGAFLVLISGVVLIAKKRTDSK